MTSPSRSCSTSVQIHVHVSAKEILPVYHHACRADKGGVVHAGLGKVSFEQQALASNVATFFAAIVAAKPKGIKGGTTAYIKSATLSSTMGKGVPVTVASLAQAAAAVQA